MSTSGAFVSCAACGGMTTGVKNFLLDCCACTQSYHHNCAIPPLSEEALLARVAATRQARGAGTIRDWRCHNCRARQQLERLERERALCSSNDDDDEDEAPPPAPAWRKAVLELTPSKKRRRSQPQQAQSDNARASSSTSRAQPTTRPASMTTTRPASPTTTTQTEAQRAKMQTPLSPPPSRTPSLTLPDVDFSRMPLRKRSRSTSGNANGRPAKRKKVERFGSDSSVEIIEHSFSKVTVAGANAEPPSTTGPSTRREQSPMALDSLTPPPQALSPELGPPDDENVKEPADDAFFGLPPEMLMHLRDDPAPAPLPSDDTDKTADPRAQDVADDPPVVRPQDAGRPTQHHHQQRSNDAPARKEKKKPKIPANAVVVDLTLDSDSDSDSAPPPAVQSRPPTSKGKSAWAAVALQTPPASKSAPRRPPAPAAKVVPAKRQLSPEPQSAKVVPAKRQLSPEPAVRTRGVERESGSGGSSSNVSANAKAGPSRLPPLPALVKVPLPGQRRQQDEGAAPVPRRPPSHSDSLPNIPPPLAASNRPSSRVGVAPPPLPALPALAKVAPPGQRLRQDDGAASTSSHPASRTAAPNRPPSRFNAAPSLPPLPSLDKVPPPGQREGAPPARAPSHNTVPNRPSSRAGAAHPSLPTLPSLARPKPPGSRRPSDAATDRLSSQSVATDRPSSHSVATDRPPSRQVVAPPLPPPSALASHKPPGSRASSDSLTPSPPPRQLAAPNRPPSRQATASGVSSAATRPLLPRPALVSHRPPDSRPAPLHTARPDRPASRQAAAPPLPALPSLAGRDPPRPRPAPLAASQSAPSISQFAAPAPPPPQQPAPPPPPPGRTYERMLSLPPIAFLPPDSERDETPAPAPVHAVAASQPSGRTGDDAAPWRRANAELARRKKEDAARKLQEKAMWRQEKEDARRREIEDDAEKARRREREDAVRQQREDAPRRTQDGVLRPTQDDTSLPQQSGTARRQREAAVLPEQDELIDAPLPMELDELPEPEDTPPDPQLMEERMDANTLTQRLDALRRQMEALQQQMDALRREQDDLRRRQQQQQQIEAQQAQRQNADTQGPQADAQQVPRRRQPELDDALYVDPPPGVSQQQQPSREDDAQYRYPGRTVVQEMQLEDEVLQRRMEALLGKQEELRRWQMRIVALQQREGQERQDGVVHEQQQPANAAIPELKPQRHDDVPGMQKERDDAVRGEDNAVAGREQLDDAVRGQRQPDDALRGRQQQQQHNEQQQKRNDGHDELMDDDDDEDDEDTAFFRTPRKNPFVKAKRLSRAQQQPTSVPVKPEPPTVVLLSDSEAPPPQAKPNTANVAAPPPPQRPNAAAVQPPTTPPLRPVPALRMPSKGALWSAAATANHPDSPNHPLSPQRTHSSAAAKNRAGEVKASAPLPVTSGSTVVDTDTAAPSSSTVRDSSRNAAPAAPASATQDPPTPPIVTGSQHSNAAVALPSSNGTSQRAPTASGQTIIAPPSRSASTSKSAAAPLPQSQNAAASSSKNAMSSSSKTAGPSSRGQNVALPPPALRPMGFTIPRLVGERRPPSASSASTTAAPPPSAAAQSTLNVEQPRQDVQDSASRGQDMVEVLHPQDRDNGKATPQREDNEKAELRNSGHSVEPKTLPAGGDDPVDGPLLRHTHWKTKSVQQVAEESEGRTGNVVTSMFGVLPVGGGAPARPPVHESASANASQDAMHVDEPSTDDFDGRADVPRIKVGATVYSKARTKQVARKTVARTSTSTSTAASTPAPSYGKARPTTNSGHGGVEMTEAGSSKAVQVEQASSRSVEAGPSRTKKINTSKPSSDVDMADVHPSKRTSSKLSTPAVAAFPLSRSASAIATRPRPRPPQAQHIDDVVARITALRVANPLPLPYATPVKGRGAAKARALERRRLDAEMLSDARADTTKMRREAMSYDEIVRPGASAIESPGVIRHAPKGVLHRARP